MRTMKYIQFFLMGVAILGCTGNRIPITRGVIPHESRSSALIDDNTLIIRTVELDISSRYVDDLLWNNFLTVKVLGLDSANQNTIRPHFFLVAFSISNGPKSSIHDITFRISGDGFSQNSIAVKDAISSLKTPMYEKCRLDQFFSSFLIPNGSFTTEEFDFDADAVRYPYDWILPSETIFRIVPFPAPPVSARKITITMEYTSDDKKKIVDFDFDRIESRQID